MSISLPTSGSGRALTLSTLAFAANFSVWILYAVLGLELEEKLSLSVTQLGIFFAAPMLTGALFRIPAGILADRYNPKHLYTAQMLLVAPALFLLPFISSYNAFLLLGLWIGISGASFTLGIRYVNDWFERNQQGTAMGVFGAGNAGAAITLVLAPVIVSYWGWNSIGPVYGSGLILMALLFTLLAPSQKNKHTANKQPAFEPHWDNRPVFMRLQVWRFGLYYYFVFGSFLALIMWLPQYYTNVYDLSPQRAMAFTLFFVATSSMVRALGGWFADRYGGRAVNWTVFWICLGCLFFSVTRQRP
ncbi:Nitrate/nitrite transporter [gamma proteobacterium IMCC2047]|nr:Nitrate/nitrite transporter [gamma proteobacterium IMCC2047]